MWGDDLNVIDGTEEPDSIDGSLVGDQINGREGDDTISVSGGRDEVFARDATTLCWAAILPMYSGAGTATTP